MASRDSQKLLALRQHTSGVSRALWPASLRRSVATNRAAQRRRLLILSGKWGTRLAMLAQCWLLLALAGISMLVGGLIVAALALRQGRLLLVFSLLLMAIVFVLLPVLVVKSRRTFSSLFWQVTRKVGKLKSSPMAPSLREMRDAPNTPMPAAPLVRELETYDLSHSNIEHFLGQSGERVTAELSLNWHKPRSSTSSSSSSTHSPRTTITTHKK